MIKNLVRYGYAWVCDRLYHQLAWQYDHVSVAVSANRWDAWRRLALDEIYTTSAASDGLLLELGFGTGELLTAASQADVAIVGLELSPHMHAVTDAKLHQRQIMAPRVQATALAMPFYPESFHAIIATFPAPYIFHQQTLSECWRVLRAGGRLIVIGAWVTPIVAGRYLHLPLLYGAPTMAQVRQILQRVEGAGFIADVIRRFASNAEVGGIVAHKPMKHAPSFVPAGAPKSR